VRNGAWCSDSRKARSRLGCWQPPSKTAGE